jgi:saccharopine dehydrogenase-like NADP-dependent oxidoreductase
VGVTDTIQHAGRYALRWPGWCDFWAPLKKFGFLSNKPIDGFDDKMSPHQFLVKLMGPQLQYLDGEKDVVAMRNVFEGVKEGRKKSIVTNLIIKRDLETGLLAMGMGVGYPASIVAQMIANGQISAKGVLNPAVDVPYSSFMAELSKRGISVQEEVVILK